MSRTKGSTESIGKRSIAAEDRLRARGLHEEADKLHREDLAAMSYERLRRKVGPILGYVGGAE